jgi:LytS/YehU family sensor histidine kinase
MKCRFDDQQLYFDVSNSASNDPSHAEAVSYQGIGLQNVQRRLDLLYPNQYALNIKQQSDQYRVNLTLNLMMKKIDTSQTQQVA